MDEKDLQAAEVFPDVSIQAIRKIFPHPRKKKEELACVRRALDRLVQGETGAPMAPEEAVSFLRTKVFEARQEFALRSKAYTPHLTTWLNQRRYLGVERMPPPRNLEEAVSILGCYPTVTEVEVNAYMPVLRTISENIDYLKATLGPEAGSYIRTRTIRFAECVARWPASEVQYVPGAGRFFKERRYEQNEQFWDRAQKSGFESERAQIHRVA